MFIAGGVLQPAVEVEASVGTALGDHDVLVVGLVGVDHRVRIELLAGGGDDAVGTHQHRAQHRDGHQQGHHRADELGARQQVSQQHTAHEQGGQQVDHAGGRRAPHHAQPRQEDERPGRSAEQGTEVVGGVEGGHE